MSGVKINQKLYSVNTYNKQVYILIHRGKICNINNIVFLKMMETNLTLHSPWSCMTVCVCVCGEGNGVNWKVSWHKKCGRGLKTEECVYIFPAPYREGLAHEAATIKVISTFKVQ